MVCQETPMTQETRVTSSTDPNPLQPLPGQAEVGAAGDVGEAARVIGQAIAEVQRVIVGQEHMVEQLMVSLLAKGHTLLEGVPGTAKTLAVRTFATVVGGDFSRIQFTPDLVPSDIVGTRIYSASQEKFDIALGPVFVNFVLADEINRAPAKVQSAMLELMAEKQVSIGGKTYPVPEPFIVIATQNPIESEGVYPLPEAQRDRFLLKIDVPYPRGNEEFEILRRMSVQPPKARQLLDPDRVMGLQKQASSVFVHNLVAEYIVRLVLATRTPGEFGMPDLEPIIQIGASSRATLGLTAAARAKALIHGRDYVLPSDVQAIARDVLTHRIVLGFDAVADNITALQVVERLLAMVPPPTPVWNSEQREQAKSQHSHKPVPPGQQPQSSIAPAGQQTAGYAPIPQGPYSSQAPVPSYPQPGQQPRVPSYPQQGQQPSFPPPGQQAPSYPPPGPQQPSYPPPGQQQPSFPPPGQQPTAGQQPPASQ